MQFDFGYRDHWWSPFRLGSMLIGTEAATMPSITVSNVVPFTSAHLRYEMFMGRMSYSDRIEYNGGYTVGRPATIRIPYRRRARARLDVGSEPDHAVRRWRASQRLSRHAQGVSSTRPTTTTTLTSTDQEFGNQQVAFSSEFVVPLRFPVSAYIEYAGGGHLPFRELPLRQQRLVRRHLSAAAHAEIFSCAMNFPSGSPTGTCTTSIRTA